MGVYNEEWDIICDYCRTKITDVAFTTWISRIIPEKIDFDKNEVVLLVPNDLHKRTINRVYLTLLNDAFSEIFNASVNIELVTPNENEQGETIPESDSSNLDAEMEYTFDNFIVGSSNKFAHAASYAVAKNPATAYNPLFIYGNSGLGKTHLLRAIGNNIKEQDSSMKIVYVKGDDFTNELIESIQKGKPVEFRQKYRNADVLLVDDVQFIGGKESTQEEFFHTFNTLHESKKQIVLTSDRPPKEIKTLEERLLTRFEGGLIADVQPPDLETRTAIIKRKALSLDLQIDDLVCEFIAGKLKTSIRQLEGVVKKIKAKSKLTGEKATISSAQTAIADILQHEAPPELTVEKIIAEVAKTYGVKPEAIRAKNNRVADISNARQIAIYITKQLTNLTMVQIGNAFGGRHYSTIVYTVKQVKEDMEHNRKIKETIDDIEKNIRDR